jgi:hypothetical protein
LEGVSLQNKPMSDQRCSNVISGCEHYIFFRSKPSKTEFLFKTIIEKSPQDESIEFLQSSYLQNDPENHLCKSEVSLQKSRKLFNILKFSFHFVDLLYILVSSLASQSTLPSNSLTTREVKVNKGCNQKQDKEKNTKKFLSQLCVLGKDNYKD